ncbi:MAG TPA: tetratricopeptide repeat protein [Chloroflexi bacterium]|nr:tetratricopeptide repeat protein [Chloroflexota bacterium]
MLFSIRDSRSEFKRRLGCVLIALGLALLLLWPLRTGLATVIYNNVGSLRLNRALLAPGLGGEARTERAARAGQAFQRALAWDPLNGQAYYNLGAVYEQWQATPARDAALDRAAALSPGDVVARFRRGQALAARGLETRALREWRAAGADEYFIHRGLALAGAGDPAAAVAQYEQALALNPESADAYYYLGRALSALGQEADALAALESAAALEPPVSPRRYLLRAEVYVARQAWESALEAFGQAAVLSPDDPAPHYRMGWLLAHKLDAPEAALPHWQWALRVDPGYVPARMALGQAYAEQGACDEARDWLDPLLPPDQASSPASAAETRLAERGHGLLGDCFLQQARYDEALDHLARASSLAPDDVSRLLPLARAYAQASRYHDAIAAYRQALALDPGNAQARQGLAELGWFEAPDDDG